jgi:hypothetical protein
MSHSELAIAGLYDHEHDSVREQQRHIPDWGGDDVFATTPRRRRFDRGDHAVDRARHMRMRDTHETPLPIIDRGEEPTAELALAEPVAPAVDAYMEPPAVAPNGRRMVTITGHPGAVKSHRPLDSGPRRPPRTFEERITHAPERIAMWAFALGLLLIVIAIASS